MTGIYLLRSKNKGFLSLRLLSRWEDIEAPYTESYNVTAVTELMVAIAQAKLIDGPGPAVADHGEINTIPIVTFHSFVNSCGENGHPNRLLVTSDGRN